MYGSTVSKKVAKKKTAGDSAKPELVEQEHGGALYAHGVPGNKGGGRPPDEFKAKMRELASSDEALEYLKQCIDGEHGPKAAISAHKHITERGYGKEPSPVEVGGKLKVEVAVVNEVG